MTIRSPLRIVFRFSIVLMLIQLFACEKYIDALSNKNAIPESIYTGKVSLPYYSPLDRKTMTIISATEDKLMDADGTFTVSAPDDHYSFFYAEDVSGKTVGISYQDPTGGIAISDSSTCVGLVELFPIDWGILNLTPSLLKVEIEKSSSFPLLLSYVTNIMVNDPTGLMDYGKHPTLLKTAAAIVVEVVDKHGGFAKSDLELHRQLKTSTGNDEITWWRPRIEDIPKDPKVTIFNPTGTPYGISFYDKNSNSKTASSYGLLKTPLYVDSWGLNWWVLYKEGKIDVSLGDGSWELMLSRIDPWYFVRGGQMQLLTDLIQPAIAINQGDYMAVLRGNARAKALLATSLNVVARILGIVSVVDPTEATGFVAIALEQGPQAVDLLADLTLGDQQPLNRSKEQVFKWVLKVIKLNQDVFISWAKKNGVKIGAKALEKSIENLTVVLDCVSAGGDIVRLSSLILDSFLADQDIVYTIEQKNGNAVINSSLPPVEPTIEGSNYCNTEDEYKYEVSSTDADDDIIKYHIYYGDGTDQESPFVPSGTHYSFTHKWRSGTYEMFCSAEDEHGASSAITKALFVTATPEGDFSETFEGFGFGEMPSNENWDVYSEEPSQVVISSLAYEGTKSIRFIDYDPSIGEVKGAYASVNTSFSKNLKILEASFMVENLEDAFGIRAWGDNNEWSSIAYYVVIDRGELKWVKEAADFNDSYDFIPISRIKPGTWYKLKLVVDWSGATYDIFLDNVLVRQSASFVATARNTPISNANNLQIVAFTTTNCRSAYLDNIYAKGALAEPLKMKRLKKVDSEIVKRSSGTVGR